MPSYVVTGVSKGLGWEFLHQLSSDSNNTVVGIVRDKPATERKVSEELEAWPNIHILQADITDYDALKQAATDTAEITDGSLDYLIANAGAMPHFDAYDPIGVLGNQPKELEEALLHAFKVNVIGNVHLFNLFTPLILKGKAKKVVAISSGQADQDVITKFNIDVTSVYSTSKAALNLVVAKFSAQYSKDGVLFMSICPGMVDTGHMADATEEQIQSLMGMMQKFVEYAPHFTGPSTPNAAIKDVISVIDKASVEKGDGGSFVSHFGNKQWI